QPWKFIISYIYNKSKINMAGFFKRAAQFSKMTNALNHAYMLTKELRFKSRNLDDLTSQAQFSEICDVAFLLRKGVLDRMYEYLWGLDTKIILSSIGMSRITIQDGIEAVSDELYTLSNTRESR